MKGKGVAAPAVPLRRLSRLTTEHHGVQDRVRLSGELGDGSVLVLWLTQRLLARVVPELLAWLEAREGDLPRGEVMQEFKQQSAASQIRADAPVAASRASGEWLVTAVDLQKGAEQLRLVFRAPDTHNERIALELAPLPLRQWLSMLLMVYRRAGWPLEVWPAWMREQLPKEAPARGSLH